MLRDNNFTMWICSMGVEYTHRTNNLYGKAVAIFGSHSLAQKYRVGIHVPKKGILSMDNKPNIREAFLSS